MTQRKCGTCRHFEPGGIASSGWCRHPLRQDLQHMVLVRKSELACRNDWDKDLWEAAGQDSQTGMNEKQREPSVPAHAFPQPASASISNRQPQQPSNHHASDSAATVKNEQPSTVEGGLLTEQRETPQEMYRRKQESFAEQQSRQNPAGSPKATPRRYAPPVIDDEVEDALPLRSNRLAPQQSRTSPLRQDTPSSSSPSIDRLLDERGDRREVPAARSQEPVAGFRDRARNIEPSEPVPGGQRRSPAYPGPVDDEPRVSEGSREVRPPEHRQQTPYNSPLSIQSGSTEQFSTTTTPPAPAPSTETPKAAEAIDMYDADVRHRQPDAEPASRVAASPAPPTLGQISQCCATCRDFRPSEGGGRGWCNNRYAFENRQMVQASDLACAGTVGHWWTPSDDWWMQRADISHHSRPTPIVDQYLHRLSENGSNSRRSGTRS